MLILVASKKVLQDSKVTRNIFFLTNNCQPDKCSEIPFLPMRQHLFSGQPLITNYYEGKEELESLLFFFYWTPPVMLTSSKPPSRR